MDWGWSRPGPWPPRGVMPNLGALMARGQTWSLRSPLPEVSPVCWGSMFSGVNPGEHGVFGFGHPVRGAYQVRPVDSGGFKTRRIWERMSARNRPSVVLNVPLTYPARPLVGAMVSGFVVVSLERAVYPPALLDKVKAWGYQPEADMDRGLSDPEALLDDLDRVINSRLSLFSNMLSVDWELFVGVITDTDRINHFFHDVLCNENHPLQNRVYGLFSRIDDFIGRLWDQIAPGVERGETSLLLAADHSFGPIKSEVYLNRWLVERGYLKVEGEPGQESILRGTLALALDPGRIYLHSAERYPLGHLTPGPETLALRSRLREELLGLKLPRDGTPVAQAVHYKEDLYQGPYVDEAPDLVLEPAPGISLRAGLGMPAVFGRSHLQGTHRPDGALALWLGPEPAREPRTVQGLCRLMAGALDLD